MMQMALHHLVSDPSLLSTSNGNLKVPLNQARLFFPTRRLSIQLRVQKSVLCASKKRKRFGTVRSGRSGKLMLESACAIASKLNLLPEPLELLLREFTAGNGGGNGFWNGFGGGGWFDGWNRRRRPNLGMVGISVVCGVVGLWFLMGKGIVLDVNTFFGGFGLVLFGLSVEGWKRGVKDWILGFCCCAFLVGLVLKRDDFQRVMRCLGSLKKNRRRKIRVF